MRFTILIALLTLCVGHVSGQLKSFRNQVKDGYNFWLYTPDIKDDTLAHPLPVLIFLHGQSLTGNHLDKVRRYGVIDAIEKGRRIDAIVIAPQCPAGTPWMPNRIMNVLNWVQSNYQTDTNRVYVAGMSLGGYGTMDFAGTYPDRVTAAAALCGGGTPKLACNLAKVPLWVMHGTADRAVPLSESQKMVDAIAACGDTSRLIFTKFPGYSHGDLARVLYSEDLFVWLLSHDKCDTARTAVRSLSITPASLKSVYRDLGNSKGAVKVVYHEPEPAPTSASTTYHTVKKGDTLSAIAAKHKTSVKKLCQLNGIKETTILQIGMKIKLR
jgi:poly(3-hydroxybutyrate) depolymerase